MIFFDGGSPAYITRRFDYKPDGTGKYQVEDFAAMLVFNYLIANGDAHLKNFSLMETEQGDYLLSPAYDLLCTALHVDDSRPEQWQTESCGEPRKPSNWQSAAF